jgi:hypothetical protein
VSQGAELRNLREECPGKPHLAGATIMAAGTTTEGVLVLNSLLNPIFVNGAAAQIVAYPATFQAQNDLERVLASKICPPFVPGDFPQCRPHSLWSDRGSDFIDAKLFEQVRQ